MRYIIRSTNVGIRNHALRKQKNTIQNNEFLSETCEALLSMMDESGGIERSSAKTESCRYFGSPGGCFRGNECLFAHGKEKTQHQKNPGAHLVGKSFTHKIFVGGLPLSIDSEFLGKFFSELFGSVEDAVVIGEPGNTSLSQGSGFVTFENKTSVSDAVETHFVNILGKQVEIKGVVPKCVLLNEYNKLPSQQRENGQLQPQAPRSHEKITASDRPEQLSWADKVIQGQQRKCANELQSQSRTVASWVDKVVQGQQRKCLNESQSQSRTNSTDKSIPAWFRSFKKWFPGFLSKRLREGEFYSLSSLKLDFKISCGLELDHASLGYPKLSDFMGSLSGICCMKVVPTGAHGTANNVILIPNLPEPHPQLNQSITIPCTPLSPAPLDCSGTGNKLPDNDDEGDATPGDRLDGDASVSHSCNGHFDDFDSLQELVPVSCGDFDSLQDRLPVFCDVVDSPESNSNEGSQIHVVPVANPYKTYITDTVVRRSPREFLKVDTPSHGQSRLSRGSYGNKWRGGVVSNTKSNPKLQLKQLVFEDLARREKRRSHSVRLTSTRIVTKPWSRSALSTVTLHANTF